MTDGELQKRLDRLEAQVGRLYFGVSGLLLAGCLLAGLWNLAQALNIGRFSEIRCW